MTEVASRLFDVVVAGLVLLVAWPVLAAVAVAIRLTMGSPVMFHQQRAGRDGKTFELVKFRTMRTAAPGDDGPETDEARLTKLGKVLRASSLDELPTLVNVLRADVEVPCLDRDQVLAAAPAVEDGRFRVPPVLGEAP